MNLNSATPRVLALDLRSRSMGFVVFEGPDELLDWGVRSLRDVAGRSVPVGHRLAPLLSEFQPTVVLLKSSAQERLRRKPHLEDVLDTIESEGDGRIAVRFISPQQIDGLFHGGVRNKNYLAAQVAKAFPDLAWKLPAPRIKIWQREHYRMSIFDAAALALAYYGHRASER